MVTKCSMLTRGSPKVKWHPFRAFTLGEIQLHLTVWSTSIQGLSAEPFLHRTCKLPCIFAALFVCYSSRLRLRDSLLRPCYDFLLFFTTQTRPVHRETDSGDEKFITPINKIHNPILGYDFNWNRPPSVSILGSHGYNINKRDTPTGVRANILFLNSYTLFLD